MDWEAGVARIEKILFWGLVYAALLGGGALPLPSPMNAPQELAVPQE